jgi:Protein of unknown function (DUF2865)
MKSGKLFAAIAAFAACFAFTAPQAEARAAICSKLERQLASASGGSAGNSKFSSAARAQAQQLQIARSQARRAGCSGSFFSDDANSAYCGRLNSTIRRMESNLSKLQNRAGGGSASVSKARIRAALDANDCYRRPVQEVAKRRALPEPVKKRDSGLFTMLFGGEETRRTFEVPVEGKRRRDALDEKRQVNVIDGNGDLDYDYPGPGGTFRTLCVRTCDGYYFPVSFSTTSSHFATDEKSCAALCPGTETKLYIHSVPDQEPEEMVSLDREPYMSLPTAFAYRVKGINATPGCTCQAPGSEAQVNGDGEAGKKKQAWIPLPTAKPDMNEDSETALNRVGGLGAAEIHGLVESKSAPVDTAGGRKIRVVGPVYLPAQSKAEVAPIPGHVSVQ